MLEYLVRRWGVEVHIKVLLVSDQSMCTWYMTYKVLVLATFLYSTAYISLFSFGQVTISTYQENSILHVSYLDP